MNRRPRERLCECGCKVRFTPSRPFITWATVECGLKVAQKREAKKALKEQRAQRRETKERKDAIKTARDYMKEADTAFAAFIRYRDRGLPCISSGRPLGVEYVGGRYDCGHYRAKFSAPHLRYNEDNAFGQSKQDNRYGAGCAVEMRSGMIKRIGEDRVLAVENNNTQVRWRAADYKAIRDIYRTKLKELVYAEKDAQLQAKGAHCTT